MRKYLSASILAAALLLVGAGCAGTKSVEPAAAPAADNSVSAPSTPPPAAAPATNAAAAKPGIMVISMRAKGGSDEYGTATLTAVDENHTKVVISLLNAEQRSTEDAGIFSGTCAEISAPLQYDLVAVSKGRSETTLNVNLSSLKGGTKQSVRVKSAPTDAQSTFWSCGDIN